MRPASPLRRKKSTMIIKVFMLRTIREFRHQKYPACIPVLHPLRIRMRHRELQGGSVEECSFSIARNAVESGLCQPGWPE